MSYYPPSAPGYCRNIILTLLIHFPQESLKQRIEQLRTDVVKTEPDVEMADAKTDTNPDTTADAKTDTNAISTDPNTNTNADTKTDDTNKDAKPAIKSEPTSAPSPPKFANIPTWAPVKLEVIKPVVKKNYVRYPLYSKFRAGGRWSMLVLPAWELRQMARRRGQKIVDGFNYSVKVGVWVFFLSLGVSWGLGGMNEEGC